MLLLRKKIIFFLFFDQLWDPVSREVLVRSKNNSNSFKLFFQSMVLSTTFQLNVQDTKIAYKKWSRTDRQTDRQTDRHGQIKFFFNPDHKYIWFAISLKQQQNIKILYIKIISVLKIQTCSYNLLTSDGHTTGFQIKNREKQVKNDIKKNGLYFL